MNPATSYVVLFSESPMPTSFSHDFRSRIYAAYIFPCIGESSSYALSRNNFYTIRQGDTSAQFKQCLRRSTRRLGEATETRRSFWSFALHIRMAEPLNQLEFAVVLCEAHSPWQSPCLREFSVLSVPPSADRTPSAELRIYATCHFCVKVIFGQVLISSVQLDLAVKSKMLQGSFQAFENTWNMIW